MSDSLQPHELQHARPPCPSPTPRVYSNSCPLSPWCHPTISSSVVPFSSCLQSFPASGPFPISQFFTSGGQSVGFSFSINPSSEYLWLISFRVDWFDLAVQGTLKSLLQNQFESINSSVLRWDWKFQPSNHSCSWQPAPCPWVRNWGQETEFWDFQCRDTGGTGSVPGLGTKIPHAAWHCSSLPRPPTKKTKYYPIVLFSIKNFLSIFNQRVIALQYCVGFCHVSTWISHWHMYVPSLLIHPPWVIWQIPTGFFAYGDVYVSMLLFPSVLPSPSPFVSTSLFCFVFVSIAALQIDSSVPSC